MRALTVPSRGHQNSRESPLSTKTPPLWIPRSLTQHSLGVHIINKSLQIDLLHSVHSSDSLRERLAPLDFDVYWHSPSLHSGPVKMNRAESIQNILN